jgi:hypothetical protein
MRIVIIHIRNEEYLLPWWLKHHTHKFDHGVVIDYKSSDDSLNIVRRLAPTWEIVPSRNELWDAIEADKEVVDIQFSLYKRFPNAWITSLNVTEFLLGDTSKLLERKEKEKIFIPVFTMTDANENVNVEPDKDIPLHKQRKSGIHWNTGDWCGGPSQVTTNWYKKFCRSMHNHPINYFQEVGAGRHYNPPDEQKSSEFAILWYFYSPYTESLRKRRMAMKHNIPIAQKQSGMGFHHFMDEIQMEESFKVHQKYSIDLTNEIQRLEP